ncbi:MAG: T9SS type A sorting domain-containing protein [Saprospiraceae bacterium]
MKKFTFTSFFLLIAISAYCTTHTIINSGFSFSPATITIALGDTVIFDITNDHNSVEVSQATWNANGNTPLPSGWAVPFGGGMVLPAHLTAGTHFYVCQPHASGGMKGIIIVEGSTAVDDIHAPGNFSIYPNPSTGKISLLVGGNDNNRDLKVEIFDIRGVRVYYTNKLDREAINDVEIPALDRGVYLVRLRDDENVYTKKVIIQ